VASHGEPASDKGVSLGLDERPDRCLPVVRASPDAPVRRPRDSADAFKIDTSMMRHDTSPTRADRTVDGIDASSRSEASSGGTTSMPCNGSSKLEALAEFAETTKLVEGLVRHERYQDAMHRFDEAVGRPPSTRRLGPTLTTTTIQRRCSGRLAAERHKPANNSAEVFLRNSASFPFSPAGRCLAATGLHGGRV
jgi:hypothetical protein